MDDVERALNGIQDALERTAGIRPAVSESYLALIRQVENLAINRAGADKAERIRALSTSWRVDAAGPFDPEP